MKVGYNGEKLVSVASVPQTVFRFQLEIRFHSVPWKLIQELKPWQRLGTKARQQCIGSRQIITCDAKYLPNSEAEHIDWLLLLLAIL